MTFGNAKKPNKNQLNKKHIVAISIISAIALIAPQTVLALQVDDLTVNGNAIRLEENSVNTLNTTSDVDVNGIIVLRTDRPTMLQSDLKEFHAATKDGEMIGNVFEPTTISYPAVIQFTGITPSQRAFTILSVSTSEDYYVLLGLEHDQLSTVQRPSTSQANQTLLDAFDSFVKANNADDPRIPLERQILQELVNEGKTDEAISLAQTYMTQITNETTAAQTQSQLCAEARTTLDQAKEHFNNLTPSLQKDLTDELTQAEQDLNMNNCEASISHSQPILNVHPNIFDSIRDEAPYIALATLAIPGIIVVRKIRGGGSRI